MLPFELTKDTPYLALSGELWSVFYEYFNRNWSCYKGFLLYDQKISFKDPLYTQSIYAYVKLSSIFCSVNDKIKYKIFKDNLLQYDHSLIFD